MKNRQTKKKKYSIDKRQKRSIDKQQKKKYRENIIEQKLYFCDKKILTQCGDFRMESSTTTTDCGKLLTFWAN